MSPLPPTPAAVIERAYRTTTYWVDAPRGRIAVRVGQRTPRLDALLQRTRAADWAFVTAHNPRSRALSAWRNRMRQRRLERELSARFAFMRGQGVGDDPSWPAEESVLIAGIAARAAKALGVRLGQNAIVVGTRGAPARLLWCGRCGVAIARGD